jgi:hypothetical protein
MRSATVKIEEFAIADFRVELPHGNLNLSQIEKNHSHTEIVNLFYWIGRITNYSSNTLSFPPIPSWRHIVHDLRCKITSIKRLFGEQKFEFEEFHNTFSFSTKDPKKYTVHNILFLLQVENYMDADNMN